MENPNEKTNSEREFEICIEYRMSRLAKIKTSNYNDGYDDGGRIIDASGVDWGKEYESTYMTPEEIIAAFSSFFPALVHYYHIRSLSENESVREEVYAKLKELERIKENLYGWELEEISFREV